MGLTNILSITGIILILYFSYNAAQEDGQTDLMEFLKLAGILILLSLFLGLFIAVSFLVIKSFAWILIYLLTVIKSDIFTMKTGCVFSLLLVNAGGAYMLWEQLKEKREEKNIRNELTPSTDESFDETDAEKSTVTETINTDSEKEDEDSEFELSNKIGLSHRIAKILSDSGIDSLDKLTAKTVRELSDTKNIGEKTLEDITKSLEDKGYSLNQD